MVSNENPMPRTNDQEKPTDQLTSRIAAALANEVLPELPNLSAEEAEQALTLEDRQALSALGSSKEFAQRIFAQMSESDPRRSYISTCQAELDETVDGPSMAKSDGPGVPGLAELNYRMQQVETEPRISLKACYRKIRELGRGFQGVVYLTEDGNEVGGEPANVDEWTGKQALKIFSPSHYSSADAYREEMQEMSRVASVIHPIHPDNLIHVQRFFKYQGIYMMVTQAIDGLDLQRLLNPALLDVLRKSVDEQRWKTLDTVIYSRRSEDRIGLQPLMAVTIIEKCLRGLGVLHKNGIVHGDIKPSNIMLDRYGSIRLIDIGSAHGYETTRQRTWTPKYAPPEFLEDGTWTPQSDLASLGYVLVELLSGQSDLGTPTIGNESAKDVNRERDRVLREAKMCLPDRLLDLLPPNVARCSQLVQLCQKLIDPNPNNRFADAAEALSNNSNGAWDFRMEIIRCRLNVHEPTAIEEWMDNVMNVAPQIRATAS